MRLPPKATIIDAVTQGYFVLHELRLASGDGAARARAAERLASIPQRRGEQVLPLLVSIDDRRDVACVRHVRELPGAGDEAGAGIRAALRAEPGSGRPPRVYAERARLGGRQGTHSYFRMAVTESGANERSPADTAPPEPGAEGTHDAGPPDARPSDAWRWDALEAELLWIGNPIASGTGLLVVTGQHDAGAYDECGPAWPLPLSRELEVRIYESARPAER